MVHLGLSSSLSSYSSAAVAVAVAATMIAAAVANVKFIEVSKRKLRHLQTVDKVAKPCRAIKRNSIRGPRQIENLVGKRKKKRSVYYEFQRNSFKHGISFDVVGQGRFPLQGKCHEVTKGFAESQICSCRNKIKNAFIEKWLERSVQATFGTFRLLLGGSTNVQLSLAKNEIYLTFSKS